MAAQQDDIGKRLFGDIAPQLADFNDRVLFGEVWTEPTLSQRERSLITISNLLTMYRVNELPFHFRKGLENGLSREEIIAVITHLAFYAGWPPAMTALKIARQVFDEIDAEGADK